MGSRHKMSSVCFNLLRRDVARLHKHSCFDPSLSFFYLVSTTCTLTGDIRHAHTEHVRHNKTLKLFSYTQNISQQVI